MLLSCNVSEVSAQRDSNLQQDKERQNERGSGAGATGAVLSGEQTGEAETNSPDADRWSPGNENSARKARIRPMGAGRGGPTLSLVN
ncbi:hypothetical protein R1flu_022843 [Riccia fluitans]|uniref:Uncharacterized protein n=1 Tax=Riccia fluitans TaxID=41844 RepID=A0ABD1XQE6_9MARC